MPRIAGSPPDDGGFHRTSAVISMRKLALCLSTIGFLSLAVPPSGPAQAQLSLAPATPATTVSITWAVRNRFRLFRDEKDFNRHLAAESGRSILAAEQTFARETDGRGWARDM